MNYSGYGRSLQNSDKSSSTLIIKNRDRFSPAEVDENVSPEEQVWRYLTGGKERPYMSGPQKQGRPPCDRFSQYQDDAKSAFGTAPTGFWGGGGCSQPTHSQPLRLATVGEPRYSCAVTSTLTPDLNSNAQTVGRGQELGLCTVCGNWSHMRCVGVRSHNLPRMHICKECQEQPWECQVCNKNCYFSSTQCNQCGKWTHDGCSKGKGEPPQSKCIKCHKPKNRTKPRDIKICQLNCNGLKARTELEKMLTETMPDVVLLQETLLRSGMEYKPPQGYTTADRKDGVPYDNKPRGGVLTLVKEDLPFTKVAKSENTWTDFVTIKLDTADTLVANVYIPPENSKATEDWQQVLNGHQGAGRLIMAGDMNAHEHWDNFLDEDKRGTEFAEWMQSNALEAANDPNVHTRTSPNSGGRSSPDLTLASNQLIDNVRESWETGEDVGSDHLPIFFRLGTKLPPPRRRKARFVFKKARWEGFRESLSAKSERGNSVNEYYKHLVEDMLKAAKENIPMGARQGRTKPFWSSKCQELVTARNEARKVAEQTGTEADVKAFKVARNLAAKGIQREKKAFWDERCQKMSIETDLLWRSSACGRPPGREGSRGDQEDKQDKRRSCETGSDRPAEGRLVLPAVRRGFSRGEKEGGQKSEQGSYQDPPKTTR